MYMTGYLCCWHFRHVNAMQVILPHILTHNFQHVMCVSGTHVHSRATCVGELTHVCAQFGYVRVYIIRMYIL